MARLLAVEDSPAIATLLETFLSSAGHEVTLAADGLAGFAAFQDGEFDLVLVDIMMPRIDGLTLVELIRRESDVPIIVVSALDQADDQMRAFDLLVDDFVTKPFDVHVLAKRVAAVLRRRQASPELAPEPDSVLRYRDIVLYPAQAEVRVAGEVVTLTKRELELLTLFLESPRRVFSRELLLDRIWGYQFYGNTKVVNAHIQNLRRKLGMDYLEAVRGMGYRLGG